MQQHAQLAAHETRGPLNQLNVNLGGQKGQEWLSALKKFLRKESPWEPAHERSGLDLIERGNSFKHLHIREGVRMSLVWREEEPFESPSFGDPEPSMQLYVQFALGSNSPAKHILCDKEVPALSFLQIPFDSMLDWGSLTDFASNRKLWNKVGRLVSEGFGTPNQLFLQEALNTLLEPKKLQGEFVGYDYVFSFILFGRLFSAEVSVVELSKYVILPKVFESYVSSHADSD